MKVWSLHLDFILIVIESHARCCNLVVGWEIMTWPNERKAF